MTNKKYVPLRPGQNKRNNAEIVFVYLLRSPEIDSQPCGPIQPYLSYWPTRLHRLAESIPRNLFLGSINVYKYRLRSEPRDSSMRKERDDLWTFSKLSALQFTGWNVQWTRFEVCKLTQHFESKNISTSGVEHVRRKEHCVSEPGFLMTKMWRKIFK